MRENGRMDITSVRPSRGMWEPVDNKEGEMEVLNLGVGMGERDGIVVLHGPVSVDAFPEYTEACTKDANHVWLRISDKSASNFCDPRCRWLVRNENSLR